LVKHLQNIAAQEKLEAEPEALGLIARAAEGSVRDSLSLFDQAIAHAAGTVRAEDVRQMLGLADRTRVIDLFEALMRADIAGALKELRDQYDAGADPAMVLGDLAEFTHFVTRVKIVPSIADDVSLTEAERTRGRAFATKLSMRVLARCWQMLLKGITEVEAAGRPVDAAEMVLVRIAYAADLPTPDEAIRALGDATRTNGAAAKPVVNSPAPATSAPSASMSAPRAARGPLASAVQAPAAPPLDDAIARDDETPARAVKSFEALIALAGEKRDLAMKSALERDVRLVRFEDGKLELALEPSARHTLVGDLSKKLNDWTGRRWMVAVSKESGAPSVKTQTEQRKAEMKDNVRSDPLVQAVLTRFPGAEIVSVRPPAGSTAADIPDGENISEDPLNESDPDA
jgi:DNA polymerase-3 subunit gamma/tau